MRILTALPERICFIGHTHDLHLMASGDQGITYLPFKRGVFSLRQGMKYLVNVGSVGQPRDGNNQAKYVIWDSRTSTLELRYVTYNIAKTAEKILGLGFSGIQRPAAFLSHADDRSIRNLRASWVAAA